MSKERKKLKDTKLGQFLKKAAPHVLDVAGNLLPNSGVLGIVKNIIDTDVDISPEDKKAANEHIKNMFALEIEDRDSAREREVEIAKTERQDYMMLATGVTGLSAFIFIIYAIVYIPTVSDNDLFVHLMGMVEGVVIGNIFAYYYGGSPKTKK